MKNGDFLLKKLRIKIKEKENKTREFLSCHRWARIALDISIIIASLIIIIVSLPDLASYPVGWGVP